MKFIPRLGLQVVPMEARGGCGLFRRPDMGFWMMQRLKLPTPGDSVPQARWEKVSFCRCVLSCVAEDHAQNYFAFSKLKSCLDELTSTRIVSPSTNSPERILAARGFSMRCWMMRFSGRAPYAGS